MKHLLFAAIASSFFIGCQNTAKTTAVASKSINQKMEKENIYRFHVMDLSGNKFDFANLKGKKIMIVNTASKCGLTPQYKDLEAIYKEYQAKGFVVVGFPANDFASQEPGTNEEIGAFCEKNYGVTFPMMEKISVKGEAMHPLYQFLTQKSRNGVADSEVEWNFQKYLINERGELDKVISPKTSPTDPEVLNWIRS